MLLSIFAYNESSNLSANLKRPHTTVSTVVREAALEQKFLLTLPPQKHFLSLLV